MWFVLSCIPMTELMEVTMLMVEWNTAKTAFSLMEEKGTLMQKK